MFKVLAITNRHLCKNDFLTQIENICMLNSKIQSTIKANNHNNINFNETLYKTSISYDCNIGNKYYENLGNLKNVSSISIILIEKDLHEDDYEILASKVMKICKKYNTEGILHTYYDKALKLGCDKIHLPLHILKSNPNIVKKFNTVGVSIHSLEESICAENLGASYLTVGHIFDTNCKKGIPGRGIDFLKNIVNSADIHVYAIGGISYSNIPQIIDTGAYGICIMSGLMSIDNPEKFFS